jgi:hypothetical protein
MATLVESQAALADVQSMPRDAPPRRDVLSRRIDLGQGAATTVHIAVYRRALVAPMVVVLPAPEPLHSWCARSGVRDALVGGFFVTPAGPALGEIWTNSRRVDAMPFDPRFAASRACLHVDGGQMVIAPLAAASDCTDGRPAAGRPGPGGRRSAATARR